MLQGYTVLLLFYDIYITDITPDIQYIRYIAATQRMKGAK